MENNTTPAVTAPEDRIKAASFAFTTTLTSPLYNIPQEAITKASTILVQRMKKANERFQGIKNIILEHVKA